MNLLDVFRRSKKAAPHHDLNRLMKEIEARHLDLGKMWVCAVEFEPEAEPGQRYRAVVKNVGIVEAYARGGEKYVTSDKQHLFCGDIFGSLAGPVGRLEYDKSSHMWIGFFETEDEAKKEYRQFADTLSLEIESALVLPR